MSEIDLLDAIMQACTAGRDDCPDTLRTPPSQPTTERAIDVRLEPSS